jgi:hypothetical protein
VQTLWVLTTSAMSQFGAGAVAGATLVCAANPLACDKEQNGDGMKLPNRCWLGGVPWDYIRAQEP